MTTTIRLDRVFPNPAQPRKFFDPQKLAELAYSIHHHGVIQPVVVEEDEFKNYTIHDGERRWRATCALAVAIAKKIDINPDDSYFKNLCQSLANTEARIIINLHQHALEWYTKELPVVIVDKRQQDDTQTMLIRAVIANEMRDDLTPIELARSYQQLADNGHTDGDIARIVGRGRSTIANTRRLLELPEDIQQWVAQGKLNEKGARTLLPLVQVIKRPDLASGAAYQAIADEWNTNQIATEVRRLINLCRAIPMPEIATFNAWNGTQPPIGCAATCAECDKFVNYGNELFCINTVNYATRKEVVRALIAPPPPPAETFAEVWQIQNATKSWFDQYVALPIQQRTAIVQYKNLSAAEQMRLFTDEWQQRISANGVSKPARKRDFDQAMNNLLDQVRMKATTHDCPRCGQPKVIYMYRPTNDSKNEIAECWYCKAVWNTLDDYHAERLSLEKPIPVSVSVSRKTPEPEPTTPEPKPAAIDLYSPEFEASLRASLHQYQGADERWQQYATTGLTDYDLRDAIGREYGLGGGRWDFNVKFYSIGRSDPKFWYNEMSPNGKPHLSGAQLINRVRELMEIPFPKPTPQPAAPTEPITIDSMVDRFRELLKQVADYTQYDSWLDMLEEDIHDRH